MLPHDLHDRGQTLQNPLVHLDYLHLLISGGDTPVSLTRLLQRLGAELGVEGEHLAAEVVDRDEGLLLRVETAAATTVLLLLLQ